MGAMTFASTPEPPYTAVVFTSVRADDGDDDAYEASAAKMVALAREQPGFLGVESARDPVTRAGITVSFWRTAEHARRWKQVTEHLDAQRNGRARWYERYAVRIATVEREYDGP